MSIRKEKLLFEDLNVYQKALQLSIEVCRLASSFDFKYSRVRDQIIGAIISIPLNIAEGNGRQSPKDRINFYKIAKSSGFECIPLVDICLGLKLIKLEEGESIRHEIISILKMISGLIKSTC